VDGAQLVALARKSLILLPRKAAIPALPVARPSKQTGMPSLGSAAQIAHTEQSDENVPTVF
jgi:hypothetical protein